MTFFSSLPVVDLVALEFSNRNFDDAAPKKARGLSEESVEFSHPHAAGRTSSVPSVRATLGEGGRLVIPAEMRGAMGIKPGDTLVLKVSDGELTAVSQLVSVRQIQARTGLLQGARRECGGRLPGGSAGRATSKRRAVRPIACRRHDEKEAVMALYVIDSSVVLARTAQRKWAQTMRCDIFRTDIAVRSTSRKSSRRLIDKGTLRRIRRVSDFVDQA